MAADQKISSAERETAGLCADCRFARRKTTKRGSVFMLCARAEDSDAFTRYPPLPVRECVGYEREDTPGME